MVFEFVWNYVISVVVMFCILVFWLKKLFLVNLWGKYIFLIGVFSGIGLVIVK